jgi:hypothetical protein
MRRPDHDHTRESLRAVAKRCERRGSDLPGIGIARVRRNRIDDSEGTRGKARGGSDESASAQ